MTKPRKVKPYKAKPRKYLSLIGPPQSGKKAILGYVMWLCGALTYEDEDLDKDWDSLEDIVPWLKSEKRDIAFETRTGRFEVEDKVDHPHIVWCVVDVRDCLETIHSSIETMDIKFSVFFTEDAKSKIDHAEKVFFLVNKVELVGFSQDAFLQAEKNIKIVAKELEIAEDRLTIMPVSAKEEVNLTKMHSVPMSQGTVWWNRGTLVGLM